MSPLLEAEAAANAMLEDAADDAQRQALELIPVHIRGMAALLATAIEKHGRLADTSIDVQASGPAVETDLYRFEIDLDRDLWCVTDPTGWVRFAASFDVLWGVAVRETGGS